MAEDLLSFVQALDAADGEDTLATDLYTKGTRKRATTLKPIITTSATLSLDDLDGHDTIPKHQETKKKTKSRKLDVPLAAPLQRQVEQQVAFEETKKDLGKWAGVVREQRESESLVFPQRPVTVPSQPATDILGFAPQSDFERRYLSLVVDSAGVGASGGSVGTNTSNTDISGNTNHNTLESAFPLQPGALERDVEQAEMRAKKRSDAFFRDRKAAHQSRIKSKRYRKMVARERAREAAKNTTVDSLLQAHNNQDRRVTKTRRDLERAKERLTLKTRKAAQWASDMLMHKHSNDPQSRLQVMEQVRAKDVLRKEILGRASDDSDSDGTSDDGDSASEGEHDTGTGTDDELMREVTGDVSESEEPAVARLNFKKRESVNTNQSDEPKLFHNSDHDEAADSDTDTTAINTAINTAISTVTQNKKDLMIAKMKARLSKRQDDRKLLTATEPQEPVDAEFARLKAAEVAAEAPHQQDLTLAGWGSWTGPSAATAPKPPKVRVTKSIAGTATTARRDHHLRHVIITEKRPQSTKQLQAEKVPFPYGSREEYERALAVPLGVEWNTVRAHGRKTKPRVTVQAGSVVEPTRVKSKSSVVLQ